MPQRSRLGVQSKAARKQKKEIPEWIMANFYEVLQKVTDLLHREGRVSYRAIKREFDLEDDFLEDLKTELVDVKKIARDVDGKMLELASASGRVETPAPSSGGGAAMTSPASDLAEQARPPLRESQTGAAVEASIPAHEVREVKGRPVKKSILIWVGAACILLGTLLPWVSAQVRVQGFGSQRATKTGLELNEGLLSIAVGLVSGLLGFVAARRTIPAKVGALVIVVTGIVVIGVALDVIGGGSSREMGFGGLMSVRTSAEPGVFLTLLGGGLLSIGGLVALFRARRG